MGITVAVAGATGAVGQEMISILEQRDFPCERIIPLASARSAGRKIRFRGKEIEVLELKEDSFKDSDIALFSAGGAVSKRYAPCAVSSDCVVVDNTSAFRMDENVPLVVPEVNPEMISKHRGIIANPNCSTIQLVVVLKPLHVSFKIKRVVVTTFQSVSGAGYKAVKELEDETSAVLDGKPFKRTVFPKQIAFNTIPQIPQSDAFEKNGYSTEEMKMVNETKKILNDYNIRVSATCVRVPSFRAHCESVNIQFLVPPSPEQIRQTLSAAPGIKIVDDPTAGAYPDAVSAAGKDEVFVGRVRTDLSSDNGIEMWIAADNLRKGAALNAVQIAEYLV